MWTVPSHWKTTDESFPYFELRSSIQSEVSNSRSSRVRVHPKSIESFAFQRHIVYDSIIDTSNRFVFLFHEAAAKIKQTDQVAVFQLKGVEIGGCWIKADRAFRYEGWIHAQEDQPVFVKGCKLE